MRFVILALLTISWGQSVRADIFPSKPPLPCELILEALGVASGEAKRVPLYHLGKTGMKVFGGGERIVVFGHIIDPITTETRWIYAHVGQRRPSALDLPKLRISKSFPLETISLEGRVNGVAEAWANATPSVIYDVGPDTIPMNRHERGQITAGTVLRDRTGFYVVMRNLDVLHPELLDVLAFDEAPGEGRIGRRMVLPIKPDLSELKIVGRVMINVEGRVIEARLMNPMPEAKTGRLVEHPRQIKIELSRWSTLP